MQSTKGQFTRLNSTYLLEKSPFAGLLWRLARKWHLGESEGPVRAPLSNAQRRAGEPDKERRYSACFSVIATFMERRKSSEASESGFTLIELLIVIVVLGILAAIVVFSLTGVTGQSKAAACTSDGKTVEIAADAYQASHAAGPTSDCDHAGSRARTCTRGPGPATATRSASAPTSGDVSDTATAPPCRLHRRYAAAPGSQLVRNSRCEPKRPALGPGASVFTRDDLHRTRRKWHRDSTYNERIDPWLQVLWDKQGSDLLLVSGSAPRVRVDGGLRPLENAPVLTGRRDRRARPQHVDARPRGHPQGAPGRRLLPDLAGQGEAAWQRVPPEGRAGAGAADDPLRHSELRRARAAADRRVAGPTPPRPRAARPVRPDPASRPLSRPSSPASTRRARCTSSPSRTRSSTCTSTTSPRSTNARSASTVLHSSGRCAPPSARTPTSSWSARCATSSPSSSP